MTTPTDPPKVSARRPFLHLAGERWSLISGAIGLASLAAAWYVRRGADSSVGMLEAGLLFVPLVLAPSVIVIARISLESRRTTERGLYATARLLQLPATLSLLASFLFLKGGLAGVLAIPWAGITAAICACGILQFVQGTRIDASRAPLLAAHFFVLVGSVLLVLLRFGVTPPGLSSSVVLLASLHFHFTGFVVPVLIGSTMRQLERDGGSIGGRARLTAAGAIVGVPLIAAGNLLSPAIKLLGVTVVVATLVSLAGLSSSLAALVRSRVTEFLLRASALSALAAMGVAAVYGLSEFAGRALISVPVMGATHGVFNAVGFALCGVLAHRAIVLAPRSQTFGVTHNERRPGEHGSGLDR